MYSDSSPKYSKWAAEFKHGQDSLEDDIRPGLGGLAEARIFLLVDLQEIFFRSRVGGKKKINKKALKMTSKTGHFQTFFFFRAFFFFNISRKNSETSEVNQQSVFNLYIFHHFSKNLDRTITFNSATLKNA